MKSFPILLFLIFSMGFCFAAEPVEHRPSSEAYTDPEIKIAFPAKAGNFHKKEVFRSFNPMIGTTIRYADPKGDCADIYIYSLPIDKKDFSQKIVQEHFEEVKKAILGLPSKGESLKSVSLSGEQVKAKNGTQVYSAEFQMVWADGIKQVSYLKIFFFHDKIIKLRITGEPDHAESFANEILKIFSLISK